MFSHIDTNYIITYGHKHQVGQIHLLGNSFSFFGYFPLGTQNCVVILTWTNLPINFVDIDEYKSANDVNV